MTSDAPVHSWPFRLRRLANWLPMGLAYAFLYMGRYNLTVAKGALGERMTNSEFGWIFGIGAVTYGFAFVINGPMIDRIGGRAGMLMGVAGSIAANALMGLALYGQLYWDLDLPTFPTFVALYAMNMYFQSFGAVSIVTVKAPWFHVRERGTFSTIFGMMITAGIYFAFDWGGAVVEATRATAGDLDVTASIFSTVFFLGGSGVDENWMVFWVPAICLSVLWVIMLLSLRNTPGEAGFDDFETGDDSLSDDGRRLPVFEAIKKILTHPVLLYVCLIEFCSGVLRNGVMHWYTLFAKETGFQKQFWISANWGLALAIAGFIGANATGWVSDKLFQSRRAPMCAVAYALMIAGTLVLASSLEANLWFGGLATMAITMSVVAVHGILSGTATADFGGRRNTGVVVGIVDGFVYLGTGFQSIVIGLVVPTGEAQKDPGNWTWWPIVLIPFAIIGFRMTLKIWNALPSKTRAAK